MTLHPTLPRRSVLAALACVPLAAHAAEPLAWDIALPSIDGDTLDFTKFRGRVLLVTNTASFCGFAPQFGTLEALNRARAGQGLTVIGMPSNDFNQEAATNAKVKELCELTYSVDFPMAGLSHVKGPDANPFYAWVRTSAHWEPDWNFNKVLIGRNGRIAATFRAADVPDGPAVQAAMATALSAGV
jgi:glutathione peroxidase